MKTVCFDLTPFSSGSRFRGIGMYSYELACALCRAPKEQRSGLEVRFLIGRGKEMRVREWAPDAIESLHEGEHQDAFPYQVSKKTYGRLALAMSGIDLYHAADPKGTPHLGVKKTLVTCHDIIPTVLGGSYLGKTPRWVSAALDYVRYRVPSHVIAISHATKEEIVRTLGLPFDHVTVVHHGVDHKTFGPNGESDEPERVAEAIGSSRPYFLYVGAFDERKQVPEMIRAFASIASRIDQDLVITGALDARTTQRLRKAIEDCGVPGRVRLPGFLPRALLPALYRNATAHVLPSIYEGFGMTLLEAMASGCPVVTYPLSAMPEICSDAAFFIEDRSTASFSAMLEYVAKNESARALMRNKGLARAAQFTWEDTARKTLDVYRRALA